MVIDVADPLWFKDHPYNRNRHVSLSDVLLVSCHNSGKFQCDCNTCLPYLVNQFYVLLNAHTRNMEIFGEPLCQI